MNNKADPKRDNAVAEELSKLSTGNPAIHVSFSMEELQKLQAGIDRLTKSVIERNHKLNNRPTFKQDDVRETPKPRK